MTGVRKSAFAGFQFDISISPQTQGVKCFDSSDNESKVIRAAGQTCKDLSSTTAHVRNTREQQ